MAGSARRIVVEFIGDGRDLSKEMGTLEGKTSKFGGVLGKIGKTAAFGLLGAGAAAVKFGSDSVSAASDAQQSLGATETVFGKFSKSVVNDSNKAAKQFGLSANEYRENANLIGSLFKNQGVALDQLGGKTKDMIGTAADLSATFGGSTKEAVEALGSAFKGEFDPLEKYGISLKASTVSAEASSIAQQTYGKSLEDLTTKQQAAVKQQATAALIQKQSADSQGAFAKESDTLAHKQQVLAAQFDNVKVKVGNVLLPIMTKFMGFLIDKGIPAAQQAANKFKEWWPTIEKVGKVAGQVLGVLAGFVGWLAQKLWPVIATTASVLVEGGKKVYAFGAAFVNAVQDVVKFVQGVREKIGNAISFVKGIPDKAKAALGDLGGLLLGAGKQIIQGLIDGIWDKVNDLKGVLSKVTDLIPDWKGPLDKDKILLKPAGEALMEGLVKGIDKGKVKLQTVLGKLTDYIQKHQDKLASILEKKSAVVDAFKGFASSIFGADTGEEAHADRLQQINDLLAQQAKIQQDLTDGKIEQADADKQIADIQGQIGGLQSEDAAQPRGIAALLAFQKKQRSNAEQLRGDVQSLIDKGISKDLLTQLQNAGESGEEQIHALASGTVDQIAQANADNAATLKALQDAGLAAAKAQGLDDAAKAEERAIKLADTVRDKLKELLDQENKNTVVELHLDGHKILWSLKKIKRQSGQPLGLS